MTLAFNAAAKIESPTLPARPKANVERDARSRSPDPVRATSSRRRPPSRHAAPVTAAQLLRASLLLLVGLACSQLLDFDHARAAGRPAPIVAKSG